MVGAAAMYLRPVWVTLQLTHLTFALKGVQSDYVETAEGRIHYYDAEARIPGGGTPIVLVHGLGDRSEAWAAMIPKLRNQGFHVYALDLLGYGRSPKPADADYSAGRWVAGLRCCWRSIIRRWWTVWWSSMPQAWTIRGRIRTRYFIRRTRRNWTG
jgi:pimeloyl-ACP methyl ester carboxylesterase